MSRGRSSPRSPFSGDSSRKGTEDVSVWHFGEMVTSERD